MYLLQQEWLWQKSHDSEGREDRKEKRDRKNDLISNLFSMLSDIKRTASLHLESLEALILPSC